MWARTWAFLIWASVAAVAVFWGLRLFGTSPHPPAHAQPAPAQGVVRADLSRVLGADPIAAPATAAPAEPAVDQSRFQLLGVIAAGAAGGQGGPGWATISVDGKPPRTYRVGHVIEGPHVLQRVAARGADIGPRGAAPVVSLKLTALPPAATGRPGGPAAAPVTPPAPQLLPGTRSGGLPAGPPPNALGAPPGLPQVPASAEGAGVQPAQLSDSAQPAPSLRRPSPATR